MKRIIVVVMLLSFGFLAGCETIKGIGRDIENTGTNIQKTVTGRPSQS